MSELDELLKAYAAAGGDRGALADASVAHLAVSGGSVLSSRTVAGLDADVRETGKGVSGRITVRAGVKLLRPVHLCFSVLGHEGSQEIDLVVRLEPGAEAEFIAHCFFPNALRVRHVMDGRVEVGPGATMRYHETHFHGPAGGVEVVPRLAATLADDGRYLADFTLITGRVGKLAIDYRVDAGARAVAELTTRVFGREDDAIDIQESIALNGEGARGLIKARVALEGRAQAEVRGMTEGNAPGARGHVDCMEIVKDQALARAIPQVQVTHPLAKVTHEAAIGSVDRRQMETLMAHGLAPEEAVEAIVKGMLK